MAKFELYERHGVREYWIVHPEERFVTIYLLGDDRRYGRPLLREGKGCQAVQILPGLEVDLAGVFTDAD